MAVLAFYFVVCFHPNWDGISSFGSRFFVSLTPIFILGWLRSLSGGARLARPARDSGARGDRVA